MLGSTGSMRTLLPEVFYRNPLPSAVNEVSEEARYIEVNDAWLAFFGLERDQVRGRPLREIEIWASVEQRRLLRALLLQHSNIRDCEGVARRGDGSEADVLVSWETFVHGDSNCILSVFSDITARKTAERQLRESEQRFQTIVENNPQPITVTRLADGVYLNVNRAFETLFGYARAEVIGRSSLALGIWGDPTVREAFKRQFATGQSVASIETQARRRDGRCIDVLFSATVIELGGEQVLHGTVFDLTQIHQATRGRVASEARFEKVFAVSPNAMVIGLIETGSHMAVNAAWHALFGYTWEEVRLETSTSLGLWVDALDREHLVGEVGRHGMLRGFEARMRRKDGSLIDVSIDADAVELDGRACIVTSISDVSERNRAERLRAQSDARLTQVFQVGPHPIAFARAADGKGIQVNDAWHQLFGYSREDIQGQSSVSLNLWVDPEFREKRQRLLARGERVRNLETRMRSKSGAIIDVMVSSENFELDGETYVVTVVTDVTERNRAGRQIEYLATRDYLTGLPNRLLFTDRLRQALATATRDKASLALLFIDLDHFKNINDSLGHQAGDYLLTEVAARLSAVVRGADSLARQGGDEFLLLLGGLAAGRDAAPVARKLVAALTEPIVYNGQAMSVSCSIGISVFPDDADNEEDLLRTADLAMYAAKDAGRNDYRFFAPGMNQRLVARMALEAQLREALGRDQFVLHFQAKVDFESRLVTGCEALLRWQLPGAGLLAPDQFIAVAEETRLIVPIGTWVLQECCRTLRRWLDAGLTPVPIACNLSAHQFTPALPELVADTLRMTGVPARLLELEITETVMMNNVVSHLDTMRRLKELGVRIGLDDFGTGYSSLNYLRHMDLDVLKIDRSFVRDIATNADARMIVSAIIAMADKFGMKTVAEGVETPAQAEVLRRMQCREYQGFLFSHALPVDQFEALYLLAG